MTLKLRSARPVPRTLVFIALCFMLVLEAGMSDFGSLNCTMSSSRDGIAESLVNLDETAPGLAKWSYPLRVRNFSPNPVKISLCMNISSCMQGTRELSFASGVHSSSLASGRLDCHPHLGVGQMAPLNFEEGLKFASVSIVFCSAAPKTTRCFDSVENPMFSKLVIPSSDPDPQPNPWIENAHSIIVPNSTNELCWDDSDCPSYVRPFCSASLKICVDEAHIDGVCTAVCGNQPLIPNMQGEERTGYDVVQPQNLLCWCHQISQRAGFIAGVSTVGALIYLFLLFWISRARSLALQSSTWGQRNAILPVYRRIFYIVGAYVAFTLGLRTVVGMEEGSLLHKGGNTSVLEITLRCIVAFLEETIIEGLIFFFLQNGSGVDQGYRALAGGITCGFIFATLTALRRVDLPLPPLTQSGSCIGCLLDRESFGYEKPGPGDCWMQLFRNIVYKGSALVLYVFILGIGLVETLRNSMCCHSIFLYRCSRNRWNRFSRRNVGRYPRGNFYRFLVFLILLRLLDMSYMTVVLGPCSSIIGSLAWLVWFPIELYVLFRSDTIYWKTFIGRISKKRYHEDYEASARSDTSLEGVSDGTLDLRDSLIGDSAGESPGWLSPDMSHWVQSRYQDPPAYHYPPTHIQLRRSIRREGSRHRNSMDITNSQVMPKHSSSKASNTSLRSNKDLNTSRTYSAKKGSKGHRSLSAMERPREIFDEDVAIVRFNRILDSMSKADTLRGANASINSNGYQTVVQPNEEKPLKHLLSSWRGSEQDNRSVRFRGNGERGNTILSSASVGPRLQNEFENSTRRELSRGDPNSISLESNTKDMSRESEHKRITIPPVESITLDFSGVEVLSHNQLDSGSTASVYEGRFQNERVAVKICRLRTLNQKSVADFVREARTLAAFNHPNVMRLVGCCPVPPHFMIVSEYCSRGNLAKVLHDESTNNLSLQMRLFLAWGAAKGVTHVHSKGFMHGDIKPDNFIVTNDWVVKLSDFGEASQQKGDQSISIAEKAARAAKAKSAMYETAGPLSSVSSVDICNDRARSLDRKSQHAESGGTIIRDVVVGGTIAWLAPERLAPIYKLFLDLEPDGTNTSRRKKEWAKYGSRLTKAADVYSFSLVIWEILTGKQPFIGMDSFEIGLAVLTDGLRPDIQHGRIFEDVPSTRSMLCAAWAGNPALRPSMRQICLEINSLYDSVKNSQNRRIDGERK